MSERTYQKLIAWKEAHKLCLSVYSCTKKYPSDERFGLVDQMRRSASSVPTNIVEGNAKRSNKDKMRFHGIALGSLEELHYHFLLSKDLRYISERDFWQYDDHIKRVNYLITKLRSSLG